MRDRVDGDSEREEPASSVGVDAVAERGSETAEVPVAGPRAADRLDRVTVLRGVPDARRVRRSATIGRPGGVADADTERVITSAVGAGSPLAALDRSRLEAATGADLDRVRLHTGPVATEANERIQAQAFTLGDDVVFRDGMPDTSTAAGMHLLTHEVAHTVQNQSGSGAARRTIRRLDDEYDFADAGVEFEKKKGGVYYITLPGGARVVAKWQTAPSQVAEGPGVDIPASALARASGLSAPGMRLPTERELEVLGDRIAASRAVYLMDFMTGQGVGDIAVLGDDDSADADEGFGMTEVKRDPNLFVDAVDDRVFEGVGRTLAFQLFMAGADRWQTPLGVTKSSDNTLVEDGDVKMIDFSMASAGRDPEQYANAIRDHVIAAVAGQQSDLIDGVCVHLVQLGGPGVREYVLAHAGVIRRGFRDQVAVLTAIDAATILGGAVVPESAAGARDALVALVGPVQRVFDQALMNSVGSAVDNISRPDPTVQTRLRKDQATIRDGGGDDSSNE